MVFLALKALKSPKTPASLPHLLFFGYFSSQQAVIAVSALNDTSSQACAGAIWSLSLTQVQLEGHPRLARLAQLVRLEFVEFL